MIWHRWNAEPAAPRCDPYRKGNRAKRLPTKDRFRGRRSRDLHFRNESFSGNVTGTLNTGKAFRAQSRSGKVDVPFDTGEGTCKVSTLSGSIRIKIAK